ncbi:pro-resilin [Scaptodrosophila lebanonensis]|uniref:Pro-resilin n=1 Tax=Drosophila lebanonensis TaxID=7225 RepID=A0A6J2THX8_DROLE|nr:pro-resilin [Scaptodrosophila lebanonensis]
MFIICYYCFASIALFACLAALTHAEPPLPQNQYLPPNQAPQAPSNNYLPPTQNYQTPSNNYLPPQRAAAPPSNSYGAPVAQPQSNYGAPSLTSAIFKGQNGGGASSGYGGGNGGGYGGQRDEEQYGPAKYEFKYDVQDYESGNDFGHMESRDGDLAVGRYYVLLPDGRKQIVEYEADQNGYRPTIRYEQTGNGNGNGNGGRNSGYNNGGGAGGYDNNAQGKFGGYQ